MPPPLLLVGLTITFVFSYLLHMVISEALIFDRYKSPPASSTSSQRLSSLIGIYLLLPPLHHLRGSHLWQVYIFYLQHIISEALTFGRYISSTSNTSSQRLSSLADIYRLPPPYHLRGSYLWQVYIFYLQHIISEALTFDRYISSSTSSRSSQSLSSLAGIYLLLPPLHLLRGSHLC